MAGARQPYAFAGCLVRVSGSLRAVSKRCGRVAPAGELASTPSSALLELRETSVNRAVAIARRAVWSLINRWDRPSA